MANETLRNWLRAMEEASSRGRLTLCNIAHDCLNGQLPADVTRRFLARVVEKWEGASRTESPEFVAYDVVDGDKDIFLLQGKSHVESPRPCSRIMPAKDFVNDNIQWEKMAWAPPFERLSEEQIQVLEQDLSDKAKGRMPHRSRFGWVTSTESIEAVRSAENRGDLASTLRDRLGMLHLLGEDRERRRHQEVQLVEVCYPDDALSKETLKPPTFLEGGYALVYRSDRDPEGWGLTVDLTSGDSGLPEVVHPPVEFTDRFSMNYIGQPAEMHATFRFDSLPENAPVPFQFELHAEKLENSSYSKVSHF